jgi:acetyl-CoA acetyltransferase
MMKGKPIYILDALRSPIAPASGQLSNLRAEEMGRQIFEALLRRQQIGLDQIKEVFLGCGVQEEDQGMNLSKQIAFLMGASWLGCTINRLELSGFDALRYGMFAAYGDTDISLVGAIEKMSVSGPAVGGRSYHEEILQRDDGSVSPALVSAADLCKRFSYDKPLLDHVILSEHEKCSSAMDSDFFQEELVKMDWSERHFEKKVWKDIKLSLGSDENPKDDMSLEKLSSVPQLVGDLKALTVAHVAPPSDGGVGLLLSSDPLQGSGRPLAKLLGVKFYSHLPKERGLDLCRFGEDLLSRYHLSPKDIDWVQTCDVTAVGHSMFVERWRGDHELVKPDGGSLAMGNAMSASGLVHLTHMIYGLRRKYGRYGLLVQDGTGGQSVAVLVEAC